ncbi:NAD(P)/FAD-dependent oxidoreductase [Vibrio sp. Isolate31]|uniref:flavin-containing monooxygenase n=1 Tax=unclassified Vibrio TaxID=2614977 RepID=UPI001EFEC9E9|nr:MULTISPECIES: NAD(P)/FAD-dependent oxidoreductase [unclassified Vibrio]MCG9555140.1 NAD(P)/FAD-dependent oxidoreductase [Vibrio sp. Isolate32]MCG9601622.1 NAD(P)/FAD-dependent oxidoreductase [Vibrio sp. Isolate31]
MTVEKIDTLVIGAGQAGIATSEHLTLQGIPHIVLERDRIAESWRTGRWDSLVANGPAWHDRFPGLEFKDVNPDSFMSKGQITKYFEEYVKKISAPIRTGVEVKSVVRNVGDFGFKAETSQGDFVADRVVIATGAFQNPVIPPIVPKEANVTQLHSANYYNPEQLPDGGVLVIGAGSSGVQIADELQRSGKKVYLSVGAHERPPRRYRNRDFCWWLGVLGEWDAAALTPGTEHVAIAVSGAHGGQTVDFRVLANQGINLVGMSKSYYDGTIYFRDDLGSNIVNGDSNYFAFLDAADEYIDKHGLDLPEEPEARQLIPVPKCITEPISEINLTEEGVTSIIWATGYSVNYSWLKIDAFDEQGKPKHHRGVCTEQGIYFVGLPWLSRRGSAFIWGAWHDAKYIADHIATQSNYLNYHRAKEQMEFDLNEAQGSDPVDNDPLVQYDPR